jgi:arylsulfatase A-like enzyme
VKQSPTHHFSQCLALIAGFGICLASAQTTLFEQSFTPGAGTAVLNGTSPAIGAGNWVASPLFQADGDIAEGAGSATLSFTPVNGFIYTLDASFRNMAGTANVGAPEQDWVALGFAKGQSTLSGTNNRFLSTNVIGKAWMLFRGANTTGTLSNVAHLGGPTAGNSSSADWSDATLATTYGGGMDMRVVLDTTGGTGAWTATWYAKLPVSGSFTEVRATTTLLSEDINSAGAAISNPGIDGDLTFFRLTALDPSAKALIHHWKLDGDASDSVGSADGTEQGGATYAAGQFGQAVSLDGLDDFIATATPGDAVMPSTNYTLMAWVFWDGANGSRGYIAGGQNSGTDGEAFTMGKAADGTDRILFLNLLPTGGQGNSIAESPANSIATGTWHHVAYTVDSTSGTTLYLDGSPVGTNPTRTTHTAANTAFNIGNNPQTGTPNPFDGLIDDVAVFSGVLDPSRINNAKNGGAENFNGDFTPPTVFTKVPDAVSGVYPGTDLVATFSENIALTGAGTITITDTDDGSGTVVISLPDPSQVTVSGSSLVINPSGNLDFGTNFEVVISAGAIKDTAATPNPFPGTSAGQWTFTTTAQDLTAPVITLKSPPDNATDVSRATNIVATFDDTILAGTGNITLKDLDDGSTTQVIPVSDNAQVTISGNLLTIDPTASLAAGKNYAVQIAAGAVKNLSDVGFAGIPANDVTTWNFQTLATRPNVIFILGDDQAWHDYGFMQRPGVDKAAVDLKPSIPQVAKTLALDRLADEGLAFIHGYGAPVCRPALASIITGTYLQQHWITGNDLVNGSGTRIDDSTVEARMQVLHPLPRTLFTQLGYTSFQTGKWWEGNHTNGGFTHGDTVNSTATGTAPPQWSGSKPGYAAARHGDWGLMTGRVDYVNDIQAPAHPIPFANTVQTVTDFINTQVAADQPFFLWYAPFLPHNPFDAPAGLVAEYTALGLNSTEANYYANIERFDGGVGAILDHLDTKGIAGNTIIIMICDNGRQLDLTTVGKLTPYDSGVRSPILVRWPDRIKPGGAIEPGIVRTPVSMVDMAPTVHHALGLPIFPEMRGINLLDRAAVAARDTVCGSDHDVEILTLSNPTASLESRFAVRDGWKLILFTNGNKQLYQLYDGATPVDPHETANLAASNPQLVAELTMEIVNWWAEPNDFNSWIGDPALGIAPLNRGFGLDPDGDGLTNGVEAWFGTDPRAFTAGLTEIGSNGTTTTFTHPRNPQAPGDLTGTYEWSANMVDWYAGNGLAGPPGGPTVNLVASPAHSTTTVTATASGALPRLFLRARLTQN